MSNGCPLRPCLGDLRGGGMVCRKMKEKVGRMESYEIGGFWEV